MGGEILKDQIQMGGFENRYQYYELKVLINERKRELLAKRRGI